jgi:transposase
LRDGRIGGANNNKVENGMRPIARARKNWLHSGGEAAGHQVAAVASMVESCKHGGICMREYLESVLPGLNTKLAREADYLTPNA